MTAKLLRILPVLLLTATPLYAAEEAAGPLDVNVGLMVWTILIFVIVLFALGKFAWPHILGAVEAREQHIQTLLADAERDRTAAAAMLDENRRLMEDTRARVQEALNEARSTSERMREEIMSQARREQEELVARTHRDIASEREAALQSVRRDAVDLAIAAAEKLVRRRMDDAENRRLVSEYLGQLDTAAPAAAAGA